MSSRPRRRGRRRRATAALLLAAGVVVVAGPSGATPRSSGEYAALDAAMRSRLRGQAGGAVLVVRDRTELHRRGFKGFTGTTRLPIASASKWLTAATVMTFVDEGRLSLDDPVSRYLPGFGDDKASVTVRSLLAHTSGLADLSCIGDVTATLASCAQEAATLPATDPPGQAFHYSATGYTVAARVVEVVSGESFERAYQQRIAQPTGMSRTRFDEAAGTGTHTRNPDPAASAVSTLDDYARFLDMVLHLGFARGRPVLTPGSVLEIERDQVTGLDTRSDPAVQITKIPTYGLGVWRDVTDPTDRAQIISGNGGLGFYPWIDRVHGTYGVVAVADDGGSEKAVPASRRIARLEWTAAATAP